MVEDELDASEGSIPGLHTEQAGTACPGAFEIDDLLSATQGFTEEIAARPNRGLTHAPVDDLERMARMHLYTAPFPRHLGGYGLGTEVGGHLALMRILAMLGGADLVLGRLYEGHVNAIILIAHYGTPDQLKQAAADASRGLLFGVWNTGPREPMRIEIREGAYLLRGGKTFASGAPFVSRPIVTAELEGRGWQMTLPEMDTLRSTSAVTLDAGFWHPLGMEGSESFSVNFQEAEVSSAQLIGSPGDFYRDPLFRGGSIRFAAVHAGAILRLHRMFAEWLIERGRTEDPYQVARLGEVSIAAQQAAMWVERAAAVAERGLSANASKQESERMVDFANMTRLAVERLALSVMQHVQVGVGAHGLLQPSRFEQMLRDLTMYLRQPFPDQTLAEVGRSAIRSTKLWADGAEQGMWSSLESDGSLPSRYFRDIYNKSTDPWNFENSKYEARKYQITLASLPRPKYGRALEIGCSIGVLTRRLASRCTALLSLDVSEKALAVAKEKCADLDHVSFARMRVPGEMPLGFFDLIVVSEVAYYWSRGDLERAMDLIAAHQAPGGHLLLVHFTGPVPDYPMTGDQVHRIWLQRNEWTSVKQERPDGFHLDLLERRADPA